MIYYLNGSVTVLEPGLAVVECGGVGYGCRITAFTAAQLKQSEEWKVKIGDFFISTLHSPISTLIRR